MTENEMLLITKFAFTFAFSIFFGLIQSAAKDWFPYSPTFTSVDGKWLGWPDILRWLLSGVFLFFAPILLLIFVLVGLSQNPPPIVIPAGIPSFCETIKCFVLLSLAIPPLGLYDFWQAIVRRWPKTFYSNEARKTIQERHKNAFVAGRTETLLIGLIWFFIPTLSFVCVLWLSKH